MEITDYREQWLKKPSLREVYRNYSSVIFEQCKPGLTLEIGGGSGNLNPGARQVITTDIQVVPWIDVVADAQFLPFADRVFANIVMLDVLHHLASPSLFFRDASRALKIGGRIVLLEPAITPASWLIFKLFHEESVDMGIFPLEMTSSDPKDPYESNQAIPSLLFKKYRHEFQARFPELQIVSTRYLSLFAYPLSGGFKSWSLIPPSIVPPVLKLERALLPLLGPLMAFRLFVVLEKTG